MNKVKTVIVFFIISLVLFALVNVLQTIAWGQVETQQTEGSIALPANIGLYIGREVDGVVRPVWLTKGHYAQFKTDQGTHIETVDIRMVDNIIVITIDKMQFENVKIGGYDSIVRVEVKPTQ